MSLLREIQNDAVSKDIDVSATLRKCKLLAARLDSQQLEQWISWESDGYPKDVPLPEYRTLRNLRIKGHFSGPFGSWINNAEIPSLNIPKSFRFGCTSVDMRESTSSMEQLARHSAGRLQSPISADVVVHFADRIYEHYGCMAAWREIPDTAIHEVLNTVRNRVLDFALKIEKLSPSAGEAELGKPAVSNREVTQVFNTTIHGAGNVVATATNSKVTAKNTVRQGDIAALRDVMRSHGVENEDIKQLEEALRVDPEPHPNGQLGPQVGAWIGGMVQKAVTGAAKLSVDVVAKVLAANVAAYYGLPQPPAGSHST